MKDKNSNLVANRLVNAFIKNKIGLKKIPPPIPTIPEMNPSTPPIIIEN